MVANAFNLDIRDWPRRSLLGISPSSQESDRTCDEVPGSALTNCTLLLPGGVDVPVGAAVASFGNDPGVCLSADCLVGELLIAAEAPVIKGGL